MTTTLVTLDVWQPNEVRVQVNQGEVNSRFLEIKIIDKKKAFNLTDKTVIFYATKPDGNLIFNYCEIIDAQKGLVNLAMTSQMSIVPGIMRDCEIDVLDDELTKLKVKGLSIEIVRCTDFESAVESTSEFTVLDEALADVKKVMDAYSEENIMEKIMSLDGEGSGLDADLLDGKHGSEYASAAQGIRADSAIQGVKGSNILIVPDSDDYVNITPENIKAVPISRTVNKKALSEDINLSYSDVGAASNEQGIKADSAIQGIRGNGTSILPDSSNIVNVTPENIEAVPITRTVNGKSLASNITITAADIEAVPKTRTINQKALSNDILLSATDIGAAPINHGEHVPAVQAADNSVFLRNDNTWQQIKPENIGAATQEQGQKADYAIQGIQLNGTHISPDINRQVNIVLEDFGGATAEQGAKADTAIQGVKVNGSLVNPDSSRIVDIDATSIGGATTEQGEKADSAIQGVKLNGTLITPDNQKIVDLIISGGGSSSTTYTAEIGTNWEKEESGEYTQTVAVTGILASDNPIVDVVLDSSKTVALQQLEAWSYISKIETADGSITVTCLEEAPTVAIPIQLKVVR
ncbi:MAG: BppU family phage baseplate upper protein [Acutalibacteraceae bacterium]